MHVAEIYRYPFAAHGVGPFAVVLLRSTNTECADANILSLAIDYYAPARREGGSKRCFCPSICPSVRLSVSPSST